MFDVTIDRDKYVGGSEIPVIMEEKYFSSTIFDLVREKAGIKANVFCGNKYTEYGNVMEKKIRDFVNYKKGKNFIEDRKIDHFLNIRGHFDGYDGEQILEIKTTSNPEKNKIFYNYQIQIYMYLTYTNTSFLAIYKRPENFSEEFDEKHLSIEEIKRDDELIEKILTKIEIFWKMVEELKENPFLTDCQLKSHHDPIPVEMEKIAEKIFEVQQKMEKLKEEKEKLKEEEKELKQLMIKNNIKKIDNESFSIILKKATERKTFDKKLFEEKNGNIDEKYFKTSKLEESIMIKRRGEK